MVDFALTSDESMITDTVREFVKREILPLEPEIIRRGIDSVVTSPGLTVDEKLALQRKGREAGLWGVNTPEEFGGADLSPLVQSLINIELGRTFIQFFFGGSAWSMLYQCTPQQRPHYLLPVIEGEKEVCVAISEPGGGSDVRAMKTTAIRDGDQFVINGEKMWISHALEADFAIVYARTPLEGQGGITGFLVDRDMGWTATHIPTMGAAERVATMSFDNVKVPVVNVLGEINGGFTHLMRWIYDNRLFNLAPRFVGASERILAMGIEWATERKIYGRALSDHENVAFAIAESDIEIRAAKLLALNGAWKATVNKDYRHEAYAAKLYAARMAGRVVDRVLQIHGGMGYAMELPIERWYRDLRVGRIYEGADEVNLAGIARNLFKRNVKPGGIF